MLVQVRPHILERDFRKRIVGRQRRHHVTAQCIVHHIRFKVIAENAGGVLRAGELIAQDKDRRHSDEAAYGRAGQRRDTRLEGGRVD